MPVLSEHITDTQPRLSTAFNCLIIAFSFAILRVPIAWTIVTIELNASGIAATASATANIIESSIGILRTRHKANTSPHIIIIIMASFLLKSSRLT